MRKITIGKIPGKKELLEKLVAGAIPIKFCYPDEGGDKWDELRGNKKYFLGDREYKSLIRNLSKIKLSEPTNILHLGPGNGIEIPAICSAFDFKKHAYFGVDISQRMIENMICYHNLELANIKYSLFILADLESKGVLSEICNLAKKKQHQNNLLLITGQGVLCSNPLFLRYVAASLDKNDLAFITIEGDDLQRRKEILQTYNLREVENLLLVGLRRADIGNGNFLPTLFNEDIHQAEKYFETDSGEKILCLSSYKPSSDRQFEVTLRERGLQAEFIDYFPQSHTYATLCRRSENV